MYLNRKKGFKRGTLKIKLKKFKEKCNFLYAKNVFEQRGTRSCMVHYAEGTAGQRESEAMARPLTQVA